MQTAMLDSKSKDLVENTAVEHEDTLISTAWTETGHVIQIPLRPNMEPKALVFRRLFSPKTPYSVYTVLKEPLGIVL